MYNHRNLKTPINIGSGIGDFLLIAPVSSFVTIATPPKDPSVPGQQVTILDDHLFKAGRGFIQIDLAPLKNQINAKSIGIIPSMTLEQQLGVVIPGSYKELHEAIKNLNNLAVIALVKDSNCESELWYQIGNECKPAYISSEFTTGTTREGIKAWNVMINAINPFIQIYEGLITKLADNPNGLSPVFLADPETTNITGNVNDLEDFYNEAYSTNITQIYQQLVINSPDGFVQLSFANSQSIIITEVLLNIDLSTEENFIADLQDWLDTNGSGQTLAIFGTELRVIDTGASRAYFGIAIPMPLGHTNYILADDENMLAL